MTSRQQVHSKELLKKNLVSAHKEIFRSVSVVDKNLLETAYNSVLFSEHGLNQEKLLTSVHVVLKQKDNLIKFFKTDGNIFDDEMDIREMDASCKEAII